MNHIYIMPYNAEQQKQYLQVFNKRKYQKNKYNFENCEKRLSTKISTFLKELIETKENNEEIAKKHDLDLLIERLQVIQRNLPIIPKVEQKEEKTENQEEPEEQEDIIGKPYIIKPRIRTEAQKKGWKKAQLIRDMNRYKRAKEKEVYMKQLEEYKEQQNEVFKTKLVNKALSIKKWNIINEALDTLPDCNMSYEEVCNIKKTHENRNEMQPIQPIFR